MWFERLAGFREGEVVDVGALFVVDGEQMTSTANGRTMQFGRFETPTLDELRQRSGEQVSSSGQLRIREVVGDAQLLHLDPGNAGALFQVASQFNTLEMVSPSVTPEDGIDRYETDRTQGPACAVACGAGTIYRNYLVPLGSRIGQSADDQIDCLADLGHELGTKIDMQNGYALPTAAQLATVNERLVGLDGGARNQLMGTLRIGLQWNTEVTLDGTGHLVTQAYCSALPLAYSSHHRREWEPFARLVLDAAYEATFCAGVLNAASTGNPRIYLTLVGGGVFGNPAPWVIDAVSRAQRRFVDHGLDVAIVSYGRPNRRLAPLLSP